MWSQVAVLFYGCSLLTLGTATAATATGTASSLPSYPVFGTKRYTRGNVIPAAGEYGGGGQLSLPVYHHLPASSRYYEPQVPPQYFPFAPYQPTADYYDDLGYYGGSDGAGSFYYRPPPPALPPQLPHRRYQRNNERYTSYGLPTYRGEYKPTPYYYSHGPSYSYSDEHESSNPLDDLHEEMLQEDERERARDYYPVGQEQWYESPSRQDSTFLRNLILYNQQLQSFGRGKAPQPPQPPPQLYPDSSAEEDFDEYDEPEPDYEYDVPSTGYRDSYGYGANVGGADPGYGPTTNRNAFSKLSSLRNSMARNRLEDDEEDDDGDEDDEDDEEVQELKSLIHHQQQKTTPSQRLPPMFVDRMAPFVLKNQQPPPPPPPPMATTSASAPVHHFQQKQQSIQQQQRDLLEEQRKQKEQLEQAKKQQLLERQQKLLRTLSSDYQHPPAPPPVAPEPWQRDSPSYGAAAAASYGDYDTEYDEDDDDSWSHWDRKRNVQPKKATFASKSTTTAKPTVAKALPSGTTTSPTTTDKPSGVQHHPGPVGSGQKEVVLPRPTSPRNAFAASLLSAVQAQPPQDGGDGVPKMDEASKLKQIKSSKIYDTLKAMITMRQNLEDADLRQQLEHQKQLAHIHKRFVSNEESLVQQLDGLKRSA